MSINEDDNPISNKYSNYVRNHLFSAQDDWVAQKEWMEQDK